MYGDDINEVAIKLKIQDTPIKINALKFYIIYLNKNNRNVNFRINFYSIKNNMPDKKICFENILQKLYVQKEGWVTINLSEYDIYIYQDFYLSLEFLPDLEKLDGLIRRFQKIQEKIDNKVSGSKNPS